MDYGNEDQTEINIPTDLEFEACIHIGYEECNFGEIDICRNSNYFKQDYISEHGNSTKYLGNAIIKVDTSNLNLNLDVRGILISQIAEEIKAENARHIKQSNYLEAKLSKLKAIGYDELERIK